MCFTSIQRAELEHTVHEYVGTDGENRSLNERNLMHSRKTLFLIAWFTYTALAAVASGNRAAFLYYLYM